MKKYTLALLIFLPLFSFAQENNLKQLSFLIGKWEGEGSGFNATKSKIQSEFNWILNKKFIEVKNHSEFAPTDKNTEGEIHEDRGIISFDKNRKMIVFRQFHIEGFINQYILNDSLSNKNTLIFESEAIENFVPGGKARFTIRIKNQTEIETLFDVGFPGKEMSCFGQNQLKKN